MESNSSASFQDRAFSDPFGAHFSLESHAGTDLVLNDPELVFSGRYERTGDDLSISRPFETAVIHNYFRGAERETIHAPDGSALSGAVVCALTLNVGAPKYAQNTAAAPAAKAIGRVEIVKGDAQVIRNGQMITLHVGDLVYKGDAVQTGPHGLLSITFLDGTAFSLDADARMVLNEMVYDPKSASNSSLLTLVQGSIGFIAGDVAHKGEMKVDTPVATMGIRGTAVHVTIEANHGRTHFSVMKESNGRVGRYALYDHDHPPHLLRMIANVSEIVTLDVVNGVPTFSTESKSATDFAQENTLTQNVYQAFQIGQQHPLRAQLGLEGPNGPEQGPPQSPGHNQGGGGPGSPPLSPPNANPEGQPTTPPTPSEPQNAPPNIQPTPSPTPSTFGLLDNTPATPIVVAGSVIQEISVISDAQGGVIGPDSKLSTINLLAGVTDNNPSAKLGLLTDSSGQPVISVGVVSGAVSASSVAYTAGADGALQIDPSQFQSVAPGTTATLAFHYTLVDSSGAQAAQTAVLTIDGGPAVTYGNSSAPIQVGANPVTLTPTVTSPEGGDTFAFDPPGEALLTEKGLYGSAVINTTTGQITYTPSAAPGVEGVDAFTISDTDSAGVTTKTTVGFAVDGGTLVHYATLNTSGAAVVDQPTLVSPEGGDTFAFVDDSGSSLLETGHFGAARISPTTGEVTFTPSGSAVGSGTDVFDVSDTDSQGVITTTTVSFVFDGAVAPTITGTTAGQTTADEKAVSPFSGVTIGDANSGASETLTITLSGGGGTLSGTGLSGSGPYTLTGSAATVTSELDALQFTAAAGAPGSQTTTTFTLSDASSAYATPTVNATTTVIDVDGAVAPTITGTTAGQTTADEKAVSPFSGVTIGDANSGASETLTITLSGGGGTLSGNGLSGAGPYTLTGSAATVTSELDALQFTAAAGAPGSQTTTTFTLSDASSAYATPTVNATTTVIDVDGAVAPTITGTTAGQTTADEKAVSPFSGVTIGDANSGASETLTITLSGGGGTLSGNGLSGAGPYTLTGSAATVTSELDALVFTPTAGAPGSQTTTTFTLSDASSAYATPTVNATTTVIDVDGAVAPTITGTTAGQTTADEKAVSPFSGVTIGDANSGASETLTITLSGGGGTLSGNGLSGAGPYTLTGSAATVTSELDALQFTAAAGAPGSQTTTTFTLSDASSAYATATVNATTTVIDVDGAVAPTITGTTAGQTTADEKAVSPFSGVTIGDANSGASETLTITLSGGGGTLSGNGLSGAGPYTLTGSAATVTSELDALQFTAAAGAPGSQTTTTFTLSDASSAYATATVNATTTVIDVDGAVAPTITGTTAGQTTANEKAVSPFSGVTIGDANSGASETLTITLSGGGGTLSGKGLSGSGPYTLTGSAATVTSELDALQFTAAAGAPGSQTTTTFTLSDASSAYATATVNATTTVIDVDGAVAPTITGTTAGQTTADEKAVSPFSGVTIGDANSGASETLTITLSGGGGTLSGNGLSGAGPYTLTGSAATVTSELDALQFTAAAGAPGSQTTTTFTLSDASSAYATATVNATTTVIDVDGAVAPTITGTTAGQTTADEKAVSPFSGVTIGDANSGASETLTITLSGGGGTLSGNGLSGAGPYTLTGSAATVTSELDALQFTAAAGAPGSQTTTTFTLSDASSAYATPTVNATTTVIDVDGAVAPTITGTTAGQTTADEKAVSPFSGVTIGDANSGASETLTITLSGGGGTLSGNGLSGAGPYTLTGSAATVTSELDALQFTAAAGAPGSQTTTTFTLSDASSAYATATVNATTTVIDVDGAVAPTITGTTAGQTTADEKAVSPFSGVTIGDANSGASETLTITLSGGGGTLSGNGLSGAGPYTLTGSAATVTSELDALQFTAAAGAPGSQTTTTFTLSDASSAYATPTVNATTTVIDVDGAVAPTITGTTAGQTTADEKAVSPFSGVTIGDANSGASETLTITLSGGGGTLSGNGLSGAGPYTLTGSAATVTSELDALVFTPTAGAPGSQTTTTFTLSDASSAYATPTVNATTTVIDVDGAVAPTITGTTAGQTTADEKAVSPFSGVTIGDANSGASETLTITLSGGGGTLSGTGLSGAGPYTLTGSAATVTSELDALVFTPTAGAPGSQTTTTFTLSDASSAYATPTVNATTTVIDVDGAVAPTITGTTAGQTTADEKAVSPFSGVTIGDANSGASETLTITLSGGGGTLSGNGLSGAGPYTLTGSAATVTSELDALQFTAAAGAPGSQTTTTFTLSDASSAYATATVNATTTVIDVDGAVAPTITGTTAGQTTADEKAVSPFSGVTIGDANSGASETLTITLSGGGGTLSGNGLSGAGPYTLTGSAATVTSELDALQFTPAAGAPGSQTTTTFTLSDASSAYATATVNATTTVIDVDGAVAPTITGTTAGQTTANEKAVSPFSGVTIGDANSGASETLTITLSGGGGTLSGTGLSGSGPYTLTGSAATVTSELDALQFTAAAGAPGSQTTTTFTLSDASSAYATATVNATTTVIDVDGAVAPTITGTTAGQTTANEKAVSPFSGVTIGDANSGASETLTITLSGGGGTLSGNGLSGAGPYTLTGSAATVTSELDALVFTPTAGAPGSQTTTTFTLSDASSAYATPTVNATTTVTGFDLTPGTIVWKNVDGGDWNTGSNWSTDAVPGATNSAAIITPVLVSFASGSDEVNQLETVKSSYLSMTGGSLLILSQAQLDGSVFIQGGTLTLGGTSTIASFTQISGTIATSGSVTISGLSEISGGAQSGSGTTIAERGVAFASGSYDLGQNSTLELQGTSTASGSNFYIYLNGVYPYTSGTSTLKIDAGATFNDQTTGGLYITGYYGPGVVDNLGTFIKSGLASVSTIAAAFDDSGTVNVESGTLDLSGGGVDTGALYEGAGTIEFGGGTRTLDAASKLAVAHAEFSGGTTTIAGAYDVTTTTVNGGAVTLNDQATTVSLIQTSGTLDVAGALTVTGLSEISGGVQSGSGTTIAEAGVAFTSGSYDLGQNSTLELQGTSTASGSNFYIYLNAVYPYTSGSSTLKIDAGATFNDQTTGGLYITGYYGPGVVDNLGTFVKSGLASVSTIAAAFDDSGTVNVESGTLDLSGGGVDTGALYEGAGTIEFGGGTRTLDAVSKLAVADAEFSGGTTTIAGAYDVSATTIVDGGTANISGALTSLGSVLAISSGTLNIAASISVGSLIQTGGVLEEAGKLTVTGLSTVSGGAQSGSGTTIAEGGVAFTSGNYDLGQNSTLELQGTSTASGSSFDIYLNAVYPYTSGSSTLKIDAGATFNDQTTGGLYVTGYYGPGVVDNLGTFVKSGLASVSTIAAAFDDSGTVNVESGTLDLSGGGVDTGALYEGAGTIEFGGGTRTLDAVSKLAVANAEFSGGTTTIAGAYDVSATTIVDGGTANISGALTSLGSVLAISSGTLNIAASISVGSLIQTGGVLEEAGKLTVTGLSTVSGGAQSGSGTTIAEGGVAFTSGNYDLGQNSTLELQGTSTASGSSFSIYLNDVYPYTSGTSTLKIDAGATFDDQTTGGIYIEDYYGPGVVDNLGTFVKSGPASVSTIAAAFDDYGTVNVESGTLDLSGGGVDTGALYEGAGTIEFGGGTRTLDVNSMLDVAHAEFSGGTTTIAGAYDVSATTTVNGGVVTFNDQATTASLIQTSGTLDVEGVLTITGLSEISGGVQSGSGTTIAERGVAFTSGSYELGQNSTLELQGTSTASGSSFDIYLNAVYPYTSGSSTLKIDAGATLDDQTTGGLYITGYYGPGVVDNLGTFIKSGLASVSTIAAAFDNSGTVDVESGTLDLSGGVTGAGAFQIGNQAGLEFGASVAGGTATFQSGVGQLTLDDPADFHAEIAGITGSGDVTLLKGVTAAGASATTADAYNPTTGLTTLTLTEDNGAQLKFELVGNYSTANWSLTSALNNAGVELVESNSAAGPTITGTVGGQATANEAAVSPFSGVTIGDANSGANETLTITLSGGGGTLSGAGLSGGAGVYTLNGSAAAVTSHLDALVFTPAAGASNSQTTTTFTLSDASSAYATPTDDATTNVTDVDVASGAALWTNAKGGDWSASGNWSSNAVPNATNNRRDHTARDGNDYHQRQFRK